MLIYIRASGHPDDCVRGGIGLLTHHTFHLGNNLIITDAGIASFGWASSPLACSFPPSWYIFLPLSVLPSFHWVDSRRIIGSKMKDSKFITCVGRKGIPHRRLSFEMLGGITCRGVSPIAAPTQMQSGPIELSPHELGWWWGDGCDFEMVGRDQPDSEVPRVPCWRVFDFMFKVSRNHWSPTSWGINWSICFLESVESRGYDGQMEVVTRNKSGMWVRGIGEK